jgi:hypothetical protein
MLKSPPHRIPPDLREDTPVKSGDFLYPYPHKKTPRRVLGFYRVGAEVTDGRLYPQAVQTYRAAIERSGCAPLPP